jgi:hypothetical protein
MTSLIVGMLLLSLTKQYQLDELPNGNVTIGWPA